MKKIFTIFDLVTFIFFILNLFVFNFLDISLSNQAPYFLGLFWFFVLNPKEKRPRKRFSFLTIISFFDQSMKKWFQSNFIEVQWVGGLIIPLVVGLIMSYFLRPGYAFYFFGLFFGIVSFHLLRKLLAETT